ncbi:ankyrin repeat-containing domain protein [Neocallimastix sp. 'constans']
MCPNFCPCCKSNKQWIRHWLIGYSFFNHIRSKVNDKILFLFNAFNGSNLTNDIVNCNNDNSNSNNSNSNNSISNNNNSNNSISNNSNSNNIYSNISNSIISNSIISNVSNSIENNVYVDSSVYEKVFNFLLGGRSTYSDTPFLVVTAALLQSIIPIAIGQFKSNRTTTTKSVNAEETVRQASRVSATNEDHNFSGNKNLVVYLIDNDGKAPLFKACESGKKDLIEYLVVKHKIDINKETKNDKTPLLNAIRSENKDLVEYLIENGADINKENEYDEIHHYLMGVEKEIKIFRYKYKNGITSLFYAYESRNKDLIEYLIEHGAVINI